MAQVSCSDEGHKTEGTSAAAQKQTPTPAQPVHTSQQTLTTPTYGPAEQEKDWRSDRAAMEQRINDVAFVQQRPVLEAFYDDVVAIHEEHNKVLADSKTIPVIGDSRWADWAVVVFAKTDLHVVLGFIDELPRKARDLSLQNINSFQPFAHPDKLHVRTLPSSLAAYLKAGDEVRDKYRVNISRLPDTEERIKTLPQDVDTYIRQDDLISAYATILHLDILLGDIRMSLTPFEAEIYSKSHPANQ